LRVCSRRSGSFTPARPFRKQAHIGSEEEYERLYRESLEDPEGFWGRVASELHWFTPWQKVLEGDLPHPKWFVGGRTNLSYNALDRHLGTWRKNKAALIWEGEPGEERVLTYHDLWREVQKFANVLKRLGVKKGDRVTIYLPMIPEAAIAMLACTRIGAVHSVVFGGFSSGALADRIKDAEAKVLITADGGYRRGSIVPLKQNADEALKETPSVEHVVVVRRTGEEVPMTPGRDHWWHELMEVVSDRADPEPMEAEDPLFILYTSGSTGKPKGVLHTLGGYMTYVYYTTKLVFDLKDEDVYWSTADVGWITGHSYVVYGPLLNGATTVMYEGAPNWPEPDRFWQIVDKYGVTILYTAPTAIRAFMKWGENWPLKHRLDTLRLLGTVGEPINPEAWLWYYQVIGKGRCPIVDTWWQTETGGIMITTLPRGPRHEARACRQALLRHQAGDPGLRAPARGEPRRGRAPLHHPALAQHAPHRLGGSGALHPAVLQPAPRGLLHRGRGQARPGRLLPDPGSGGRRPQRGRAPAWHHGD
jgi:acetyl-CoA synthetase